jgi:hypothetical protein
MDMDDLGSGLHENMWLVWPTTVIEEENRRCRSNPGLAPRARPFQDLVFICSVDVALVGFTIDRAAGWKQGISAWYPIENELREMSPSLSEFLRGWLSGELRV